MNWAKINENDSGRSTEFCILSIQICSLHKTNMRCLAAMTNSIYQILLSIDIQPFLWTSINGIWTNFPIEIFMFGRRFTAMIEPVNKRPTNVPRNLGPFGSVHSDVILQQGPHSVHQVPCVRVFWSEGHIVHRAGQLLELADDGTWQDVASSRAVPPLRVPPEAPVPHLAAPCIEPLPG